MRTRFPLPSWAEPQDDGNSIVVDPAVFYPEILAEIEGAGVPAGFPPLKASAPSRYWIEVAYQFMKMDLQAAVGRFGFTILVRSDGKRKEDWTLSAFPGSDADVMRATKGREARAHYARIRGGIPV